MVAGILAYAKEHGPWHIHIEPRGPSEEFMLPPGIRTDGVIARIGSVAFANQLRELKVPVANVSGIQLPGVDFHRVTTSHEESAMMAFQHFRVRGFRNFVYVGNPAHAYVRDHHHAYSNILAASEHNCEFFNSTSDPETTIPWLLQLPKPVAVLCWGPIAGRLVIDACLSARIAVPHDVAVLGSDYDELQSEASYPPQSGIRVASEQIGLTVSAVLDDLMHGRKPEQQSWFLEPQGVIAKLSSDTLATDDPRIAAVMRVIQENFREPISMEDILRAQPMARRSLERSFRKTFGCSVVERIRQVRVNEARLLLASTDHPISQIAEKCGFSSYTYMGRVFHAETGMSPRDYRAQFRARKTSLGPGY